MTKPAPSVPAVPETFLAAQAQQASSHAPMSRRAARQGAYGRPVTSSADMPVLTRRELREREERARAAARRARAKSLPQVGVVGVLGLATIVAPLVGDVLPSSGHSAEAVSRKLPVTPPPQALTDFRVVPEVEEKAEVPVSLAAPVVEPPTAEELAAARLEADRASRDFERQTLELERVREALPGCEDVQPDLDASNGRMSLDNMCELWGTGHYLRPDAAMALARLTFAYEEQFGTELKITDSYRSFSAQVRTKARKPGLAAVPGTSQHGFGLAIDLGGGVEKAGERYQWLLENAPTYGWDNPEWARKGGSGPYEPWHWEYVAGQ